MVQLPFTDRLEAGKVLGEELLRRDVPREAVILALTRGGVPVGFAAAEKLNLPLDFIVVRKIGVPWQPELAMGAIAGTERYLDEQLIRGMGIHEEDVERVLRKEEAEMKRRETLFRRGAPAFDLKGKTALLVDDGLATGSTMLAAVKYARILQPARVVVAVPVGSEEACRLLRKEADEVICLATPEFFLAVGEWYRHFPQVSDEEVMALLVESRRRKTKTAAGSGGL